MRVIAGTARSLPLKAPKGMDTRPTTDRIKETLFNVIQQELFSCVFVDLFSGSGAIGIEALSRGAGKACFVEQSREAISCIEQNLAFTKFTERAIVMKQDVRSALCSLPVEKADIIFMDPPYGNELEKDVLNLLRTASYVSDSTIIIVEADLKTDFSYLEEYGYQIVKTKDYKTNRHLFLRRV